MVSIQAQYAACVCAVQHGEGGAPNVLCVSVQHRLHDRCELAIPAAERSACLGRDSLKLTHCVLRDFSYPHGWGHWTLQAACCNVCKTL